MAEIIHRWEFERRRDYITNLQLESAYDFCNLCGPLWLKQKGSYIFLLEGMYAAS